MAAHGHYSDRKYPEHLHRVRFKDRESGKALSLLPNHTARPALTIAALHTRRGPFELFLKWIKQHLRREQFLGPSENAVTTQVGCAVSTCLLINIAKKELQLEASLYTGRQILPVSAFE